MRTKNLLAFVFALLLLAVVLLSVVTANSLPQKPASAIVSAPTLPTVAEKQTYSWLENTSWEDYSLFLKQRGFSIAEGQSLNSLNSGLTLSIDFVVPGKGRQNYLIFPRDLANGRVFGVFYTTTVSCSFMPVARIDGMKVIPLLFKQGIALIPPSPEECSE